MAFQQFRHAHIHTSPTSALQVSSLNPQKCSSSIFPESPKNLPQRRISRIHPWTSQKVSHGLAWPIAVPLHEAYNRGWFEHVFVEFCGCNPDYISKSTCLKSLQTKPRQRINEPQSAQKEATSPKPRPIPILRSGPSLDPWTYQPHRLPIPVPPHRFWKLSTSILESGYVSETLNARRTHIFRILGPKTMFCRASELF